MFRKEALDRLSSLEELDELMRVTNPRSWLALLALGVLLAVVIGWGLFATIPIVVSGRGALTSAAPGTTGLGATVFVSPETVSEIRPGMQVGLALSTIKKEQYGLVLGTVSAVHELPENQAGMLRILGNDAYVQTLSAAGQLVPVQVELHRDPSTASGYQWSSPQGAQVTLREGMVCEGTILIDEQRMVDLVIP